MRILIATFFTMTALMGAHAGAAGLAAKINKAAVDAETNIRDANGKKYLYNIVIHSACTNNGRWACARTAAAVLNQAGINIRRTNAGPCDGNLALAVNEVENQIQARGWREITDSNQVLPGDVVIWKFFFSNGNCTGGGNCHVGIQSTKGTFHNFPGQGGVPGYGTLSLPFFSFKHAFRPPN